MGKSSPILEKIERHKSAFYSCLIIVRNSKSKMEILKYIFILKVMYERGSSKNRRLISDLLHILTDKRNPTLTFWGKMRKQVNI